MHERQSLLKKLLIERHVNVQERFVLGDVTRAEIKRLLISLLTAETSFPRRGVSGAIYDGATLALTSAGAAIIWTRPYPWDPFTVAEKATKTFADIDTAVDEYIDIEWGAGIDGIQFV